MLNSLSHLSAPRPASRDSRGYSKEEEEDALMDSETKDYPQVTTERYYNSLRRAVSIAFFESTIYYFFSCVKNIFYGSFLN